MKKDNINISDSEIIAPKYIFKMVQFGGFLDRFNFYKQRLKTNQAAYDATESEFIKFYNIRRYANLQVFLNQLYFFRKTKKHGPVNKNFKFVRGMYQTGAKRGPSFKNRSEKKGKE